MAVLTEDLTQQPARLGYLAGLDGLRAVAALMVVAYHVEAGPLRGGFLGVDVFFVLSGFLITRLLLEEHAGSGRVALGRFWSRRARRLLPAMAVVVAAACAWSWAAQDAVGRRQTAGDAVASLLYVANWRFIRESASYFAPLVDASPLRHLWSLAVEEQWYLAWPLVVVLVLRRRGPRALAVVSAAGALLSAAWMAVAAGGSLDRAYYGTGSRAQGLLVGSLLAAASLAWPALETRLRGCTGNRIGLVSLGVLAVLSASVAASDPWLYRGGFLLASLAAAGVVAWLAFGLPSGVHRLLGTPGAVWLGHRSYALYLWHWPVVVALTPDVVGFGGPLLGAGQAALAVALSAASYRLVEQPVRRGLTAGRGLAVTTGVMASTGVVAVSLFVSGVALPAAGPGAVLSLRSPAGDPSPATVPRLPNTTAPSQGAAPREPVPGPPAAPGAPEPAEPLHVVLLGDSQAFAVATLTAEGDLAPGLRLSAWATLGCGVNAAPVRSAGELVPYPGGACDTWLDSWSATVQDERPDVVVVMIGAWEVADVQLPEQLLVVGTPEHDAWLRDRLRAAAGAAGASGAPVVFLEVPCYEAEDGEWTVHTERNDPARVARVNDLLREVAAETGAHVAPQGDFVCVDGAERRPPGGGALRYDGVHYTAEGAAALWDWLTPILQQVVAGTGSPVAAAQ